MAVISNGFLVTQLQGSPKILHIRVSSIVAFLEVPSDISTVHLDGGHVLNIKVNAIQLAILLKEYAEKGNANLDSTDQ